MSKRLRFLLFALLCALPSFAQYTPIAASLVHDGSGNLLGSGQICALGVNPANSQPIAFNVGGTAGLALPAPTGCATVTAGVIPSGYQVGDSNLTHPANVAYLFTVTDNVSGNSYTIGPTQVSCTMTPTPSNCASGTWSLDGFYPSVVPLALQQYGPAGPASTVPGPAGPAAVITSGEITDTLASLANKPSAGVAATTNLTLSGAQTIDGQAGTAGTTIVLCTAQTTASQNGPWIMQTGAWTRPSWYPGGGTTQAFQFVTELVRLGATYAKSEWKLTTAGAITIDTTATTWTVDPMALDSATVSGVLPVANGGTGSTTGGSGTGTVNSGSGYALPSYGSASSAAVAPSHITTDATGNNLNVPGSVAVGTTLSAPSHCIGTSCVTAWPSTASFAPYGTIYTAASWSSLSAFLTNGTTPTITGGALVFTGGASTFTQSLDYNYDTTLPQWSMTTTIIAGTVSSSSSGIGIGIRSYNSGSDYRNLTGAIDLSSDANEGKVTLFAATATVAVSNAALTFTAGDTIQLSVTRNFDTFTVTANDLTTSSAAVSASYQFQVSYPQTNLTPNRGKFAIFNFGGTQTVTSLSISSLTPTGADVVCVGDSKSAAYYAGIYANAFCNAIQPQLRSVMEAGGSDQTADVLAVIPELIALHPKSAMLNIGRNDIAFGPPYATYTANYASIVSQLQTAGIAVYHLLPIYETTVNQSALTSFITSTYPANTLIDSGCENYAAIASTVLAGDNTHPNEFCNQLTAAAIIKFYRGLPATAFTYQSYAAYIAASGGGTLNPALLFTGNVTLATGITLTYAFGDNFSQTNTGYQRAGNIAQTNDITNPFALSVGITGSATAANRVVLLQTLQDGLSNTGILSLQTSGGSIALGNVISEGVGTLGYSVASSGSTFVTGDNFAQTDTTARRSTIIGQTTDSANPFALTINTLGNATSTSRSIQLQTQQVNLANSGVLALQPSGGTTQIFSTILMNAAPTVAASQVGFGSTTAVSSACGSLTGASACLVINVAGTVHYIPYY